MYRTEHHTRHTQATSHLRLFAFGTLKRGRANHHLLDGTTRIGRAITIERLPLVFDGWPLLIYAPGSGYRVRGEVYGLPDFRVKPMDDSAHRLGYHRKMIHTTRGPAWAYFIIDPPPFLFNEPFHREA